MLLSFLVHPQETTGISGMQARLEDVHGIIKVREMIQGHAARNLLQIFFNSLSAGTFVDNNH